MQGASLEFSVALRGETHSCISGDRQWGARMECHEAVVTHAVREEKEAEEAGAAQSGFEFHRRRFRTC